MLGALAVTLFGLIGSPASAAPKTVPIDIRVLTSDGKTLTDQRQYVAPVRIKASPKAACFGQGTGGSGASIPLKAQSALGVLVNAAPTNKVLRPTLVTDHDFGFPGLGLCGIGGPTPAGQFWFLKTDNKNPQISGDQAMVKRGGSVLWYRMPFSGCDPNPPFPCAPELKLKAPARAKPGKAFTVKVTAFDDSGRESPVEGAEVTGAIGTTDAKGRVQMKLDGSRRILARKENHVPSRTLKVCVSEQLSRCPAAHGLKIVGSAIPDRIVGTRGPDIVYPRQGGSRVNVRGGGRDKVICLGRRQGDTVIADRSDVVRGCKTVKRR